MAKSARVSPPSFALYGTWYVRGIGNITRVAPASLWSFVTTLRFTYGNAGPAVQRRAGAWSLLWSSRTLRRRPELA